MGKNGSLGQVFHTPGAKKVQVPWWVVTQPKEKHKSLRVLFLPKTKLFLDLLHLYGCNGKPDKAKKGAISEMSVHHAGQGMVKQPFTGQPGNRE